MVRARHGERVYKPPRADLDLVKSAPVHGYAPAPGTITTLRAWSWL